MTPSKAIVAIVVLVLALGGNLCSEAQAFDPTASREAAAEFIETLGEKVLAIQASEPTAMAAPHQDTLRNLIHGSFDLDLTSQLVLGNFWARATPEQRTTFKGLFAGYLLNTYAHHLDAYRIETLAVVACKRIGENDYLVQTSIERDSDLANAVWRVRSRGGEYRIIDVLLDGISLTLTHRSEFASVIHRHGFDGMLEVLHERISAQAKAPDANLGVAFPASILVSPNANKINLLLHQR
jgi:phospholipid transport system substrate-binding protein